MTPAEVAMFLIERLESMSSSELVPVDPERVAFRARFPWIPPTLIELWDYCGGERSAALFRLARAAMSSFPASPEVTSKLGVLKDVTLGNPGTILWHLDHRRGRNNRPIVRRDWVEIAHGKEGGLSVFRDGAVQLWFSAVDVRAIRVHVSLDEWMLELARALVDKIVRIEPPSGDSGERIVRGSVFFDTQSNTWWDAQRDCQA